MLGPKADKQILKSLKLYLRKEGRVAFELRETHELLKKHPDPTLILDYLSQSHPVSVVFKILILIHRVIIDRSLSSSILLKILS